MGSLHPLPLSGPSHSLLHRVDTLYTINNTTLTAWSPAGTSELPEPWTAVNSSSRIKGLRGVLTTRVARSVLFRSIVCSIHLGFRFHYFERETGKEGTKVASKRRGQILRLMQQSCDAYFLHTRQALAYFDAFLRCVFGDYYTLSISNGVVELSLQAQSFGGHAVPINNELLILVELKTGRLTARDSLGFRIWAKVSGLPPSRQPQDFQGLLHISPLSTSI